MTAFVYRHFDEADRLLYVGFTVNPERRIAQHKRTSCWFGLVRRSSCDVFGTRAAALAEERRAILEERPLCNAKGNPAMDSALLASLARPRGVRLRSILFDAPDVVQAAIAAITATRGRRADAVRSEKAVFLEARSRGFTVRGLNRVLAAREAGRSIMTDHQLMQIYRGQ